MEEFLDFREHTEEKKMMEKTLGLIIFEINNHILPLLKNAEFGNRKEVIKESIGRIESITSIYPIAGKIYDELMRMGVFKFIHTLDRGR